MSDPFAGKCYKKNFLKEVVARVDFLNPLPGIETALPRAVSEVALRVFAIAEPREAVQREVQIGPQGVTQTESRFTEWHFHGKDRTKTLTLGRQVALVQYKKYETYELVKGEFIQVLDALSGHFEGIQPSRVGLRYVNSIELNEPNPLDWSAYIGPRLLSLFSFPQEADRTALSRVFHNLELSFDAFNLRYRLGMHNPDYPARIRQKVFVLDLDAYTQSFVEVKEIGRLLDSFHAAIQRYFEESITEGLRGVMNAD